MFARFLSLCLILPLLWACQPTRDPNTIQLSTWGSPGEMAILEPLLKEFEAENPTIKVDVLHVPDKYYQKLHTLLAANISPDVIFINNINFPMYADNGAFVDLKPFLDKSETLKESDFFAKPLDGFRWKGQLLGIPRDASNMVIYYNKDMFDQHNLPYPQYNWSLDDMLKTAQTLTVDKDQDGTPEIFGMSFHKFILFWAPYVWSQGGDLFNADRSHFTLNQPEAVVGIQMHADLRHKYKVAPTKVQQGSRKLNQLFIQGELAMQVNGRWAVPTYRKNLKFNWDIAPFPQGPAGSIVDADSSGWVISKSCQQREKAFKLIAFLASRKAAEAFTKPGLIIPARKDVAFSDVFLSPTEAPASSTVFLEVLDNARPMPTVPSWNEINSIINRALEPVWDGKKTAKEALGGLESQIDPLL